jgi:hypothetical protein
MKMDNDFWSNNKELKKQLDELLKPYSGKDKEKFREGKFDEWV